MSQQYPWSGPDPDRSEPTQPYPPYQPSPYPPQQASPYPPQQASPYPPRQASPYPPQQAPGYLPYPPPPPASALQPYGQPQPDAYPRPVQPGYPVPVGYPYEQKSRIAAGLLGIFLGVLGIHNFYLGRTAIAVTQLLITVLSLGLLAMIVWIWALIEGIMILAGAGGFRTDARGIPLRD